MLVEEPWQDFKQQKDVSSASTGLVLLPPRHLDEFQERPLGQFVEEGPEGRGEEPGPKESLRICARASNLIPPQQTLKRHLCREGQRSPRRGPCFTSSATHMDQTSILGPYFFLASSSGAA